MVARPRWAAVIVLLLLGGMVQAQRTETFAYTGDDAVRDAANQHRVNYGGFANSLILVDQTILWPYLPSLFYETGYLLRPNDDRVNVGLNVAPEIFLTTFIVGRITGTADLVLLNEASNRKQRGIGLRVGIGYSVLGSTFDFTESTPVVRAGILIGNIRTTYMYSVAGTAIVDHQLGIAIKFDW